jgi:hypothetical protein
VRSEERQTGKNYMCLSVLTFCVSGRMYVCKRSSDTVALSVSVLLSRQEEMRDDDMI